MAQKDHVLVPDTALACLQIAGCIGSSVCLFVCLCVGDVRRDVARRAGQSAAAVTCLSLLGDLLSFVFKPFGPHHPHAVCRCYTNVCAVCPSEQ